MGVSACRQFAAHHIRVFGSAARGEDRPDSDIDFLVEFPTGYDLFAQRLPLAFYDDLCSFFVNRQ